MKNYLSSSSSSSANAAAARRRRPTDDETEVSRPLDERTPLMMMVNRDGDAVYGFAPSRSSTEQSSRSDLHQVEGEERLFRINMDDAPARSSLLNIAADERSNASSLELFTPLDNDDEHDEFGYSSSSRAATASSFSPSSADRWRATIVIMIVLPFLFMELVILGFHKTKGSTPSENNNSSSSSFGPSPIGARRSPLSKLDPVHDLGLYPIARGKDSSPDQAIHRLASVGGATTSASGGSAIPTHEWYQNLLDSPHDPQPIHRAYAIPYVIDLVGPIPGLRVLPIHVEATQTVVQLAANEAHGLTIGAAQNSRITTGGDSFLGSGKSSLKHSYSVLRTTKLGVTLQWTAADMTSSIVRGMPFATMLYSKTNQDSFGSEAKVLPSIATKTSLLQDPIADQAVSVPCWDETDTEQQQPSLIKVERELKIQVQQSDFTWLVFFSEPVYIQCVKQTRGISVPNDYGVVIQVHDVVVRPTTTSAAPNDEVENEDLMEDDTNNTLVVRAALLNNCTMGTNPVFCTNGINKPNDPRVMEEYAQFLREAVPFYPGPETHVRYNDDSSRRRDDDDDGTMMVTLTYDWDMKEFPQRRLRQAEANDQEEFVATNVSPLTRKLLRSSSLDENHNTSVVVEQEQEQQQPSVTLEKDLNMNAMTFALPHNLDRLEESTKTKWCTPTLIGDACLVRGSRWEIPEELVPVGFRAARAPRPDMIPILSKALVQDDMDFRLPDYYLRGAGDTYFSGKMLARQARVLLIAEELMELCGRGVNGGGAFLHADYVEACENATLPSQASMVDTITSLQNGVKIWLNGSAEVPFVYDPAWGGVINCGCYFDGDGCSNKFPDCPSVEDAGLNFGNGMYNDHHFHYGYMIYAAAVVSHFDPSWGIEHMESVLLLIRDIANPSLEDTNFPLFRHKDWYNGHSWASGIAKPPYFNGKNQESSSEAIAAYEAVALFGDSITAAFSQEEHDGEQGMAIGKELSLVGRLMATTEIRAAKRYWHVHQHDPSLRVYPSSYRQNVIGILWNTMGQFQTWFGNAPYLPYGIQLLPITPISEHRDGIAWLREMYGKFADACNYNSACEGDGWSILKVAMMSTVGHPQLAASKALALPKNVYDTAGGNGQSLSNLLWYVATRPELEDPVPLPESDLSEAPAELIRNKTKTSSVVAEDRDHLVDCGRPLTCTKEVLDTQAGEYSCRKRIKWLISEMGQSEQQACAKVGGVEYPNECGGCKPHVEVSGNGLYQNDGNQCKPCSPMQCESNLNRCPIYDRTFVCTGGSSMGGCAPTPWGLIDEVCQECCELTSCQQRDVVLEKADPLHHVVIPLEGKESDCPPCDSAICHAKTTLCPFDEAPYLCSKGYSLGGCSPTPWALGYQCEACCKLEVGC